MCGAAWPCLIALRLVLGLRMSIPTPQVSTRPTCGDAARDVRCRARESPSARWYGMTGGPCGVDYVPDEPRPPCLRAYSDRMFTLACCRLCPGRYFAESTLFILCASALSAFDIGAPVGDNGTPVQVRREATDGGMVA